MSQTPKVGSLRFMGVEFAWMNPDGSPNPERADVYDCPNPNCRDPRQVCPKGTIDPANPPLCWDCENARQAAARATDAARRERNLGIQRVLASGLPKKFASGFVSPAKWPQLADGTSLELWRGSPWCVVLWGRHGSGKSRLAAALYGRTFLCPEKFAVDRGKHSERGLWVLTATAGKLLFGRDSAALYERFVTCEVLALDDYGREVSAASREMFADIMAAREADELPTIVTTNLPPIGTANEPGILTLNPSLYRRLDRGAWIEMNQAWVKP